MAQPQVIEGTNEEIARLLQSGVFAGHLLRLIIDPDEEDFSETLPDPPNTIRDVAHLEELLHEGLNSGPATPMMERDWEDIRREVRARATERDGQTQNDA